ncbi:hypothetical protein GGR53DRAFT_468693 [Hypoxylon sp. FL1150]|nr:hypothetical protein GGR53DRAFT_468693 [Hypoxylon sp. FL1150]
MTDHRQLTKTFHDALPSQQNGRDHRRVDGPRPSSGPRRAEAVDEAVASLTQEAQAQTLGANKTQVIGYPCDVGNAASVAELCGGRLAGEGTIVDVLILDASLKSILDMSAACIWEDYNVNDVEQLKTGDVRKLIEEDSFYLEIGVKGL